VDDAGEHFHFEALGNDGSDFFQGDDDIVEIDVGNVIQENGGHETSGQEH
jgi:hypothetical protein